MKSSTLVVVFLALALAACVPTSRTVQPDHIVYLDDGDSLACKLVRGEILATRVLSDAGDTLAIDNASIDRIVHLGSGRDVTGRYIDRDALKVALAKRSALADRAKLEAEVAAGKRRTSALNRLPFAILSAEFERPGRGAPQVALTILNLTDKKIAMVRTRVHCYDADGRPQAGTNGRSHTFDATSRIPIGPGEDLTSILSLRNHPEARQAKVEIHYLEFSDRTWWKGKVEETAK